MADDNNPLKMLKIDVSDLPQDMQAKIKSGDVQEVGDPNSLPPEAKYRILQALVRSLYDDPLMATLALSGVALDAGQHVPPPMLALLKTDAALLEKGIDAATGGAFQRDLAAAKKARAEAEKPDFETDHLSPEAVAALMNTPVGNA